MSPLRLARGVYAIWYRETIRFVRDRNRWLGLVSQPLLYLLLVGNGIAASMSFRAAPVGCHISYLTFMYPGIIGMSVLFTAIFSAVGIIWDREFGFLKEVLVAPMPRAAVAAGKSLGITTVVMMQTAVLLLLAPLIHISLGPIVIIEALAIGGLTGFAIGCFGIFIAGRMQTLESFQLVMNVLTLPMFFLSGALYPLHGLPRWLSVLARIDPLTYGVDALRGAIYSHGEAARTLVENPMTLNIGVLLVASGVFAVMAAWSFERQD